jgi:RNA polymerase sigma-B factor
MQEIASPQRSTEVLLAEYARSRDPRLRAQIIEKHRPLVRSLAAKFARPGVPVDDLVQSGWLALIRAVDRFDPAYRTSFRTYALQCVSGEIKRHFRDWTWSFTPPRRLREISGRLAEVQEDLIRRLQREPSVAEMAVAFGVSEEDLLRAMELYRGYQPLGLSERPASDDGGETLPLEEVLGGTHAEMEAIPERASLETALASLDERRRRILSRRFFDDRTQQEVARELGLSQMSVSRLERGALRELRTLMSAQPAAGAHDGAASPACA